MGSIRLTTPPTDVALIRGVAAGDRHAMATLFRRHHQHVYALCLRMGADEAEAEDVTQEVFLRVLRHASTYEGGARVSTWLYRIARNALLTGRRSLNREHAKRDRYASDPTVGPTPPADASDLSSRLREALNRLEPEQREILVLKRFHGLTHEEIAAVCGCKTGAVRVRLHRAMNALRRHFFECAEVTGE